MHTTKIRIVFFFIGVFYGTFLQAQNNQLRAYTLKDGLPQSQVNAIVQDALGYLWIGTQGGGIARFDGKSFTVWNEKNGLMSNYIHALKFEKNKLYIGTRQGLAIRSKNSFQEYKAPRVYDIEIANNTAFLATQEGIYQYNAKNEIEKIDCNTTLNATQINDILFDGNFFWIASRRGLWKTNRLAADGTFQKVFNSDFKSLTLYKDQIIAASFVDGIFSFHPKRQGFQEVSEVRQINSIEVINGDELWINTTNAGIKRINLTDNIAEKPIAKSSGLSVYNIRTVFKDRQNNVWIGSSGGGLFKFEKNNFRHYTKDNGLVANRIYALHHVNDALWISTAESGLTKIDSTGIHQERETSNYLNKKVKTLTNDTKGRIWAGTEGKGIYIYQKKVRDSIVYNNDSSGENAYEIQKIEDIYEASITTDIGLPSDWISKIKIYGSQVWIATYADGIARFEYNHEKKKIYNLKTFGTEDGMKDVSIRDLARDETGRIWYATSKGHVGFIKNDEVTHFSYEKVTGSEVTIGTIRFHNYDMYLGTFGKGIWFSYLSKDFEFKPLQGKKDLYSDNIYQLIFDTNGDLWAGSERGVDQITLDKKNEIQNVIHYGQNDGFLGIETCHNATAKDAEGNLWFGTIYGLTKYTPSASTQEGSKPQIHFENIEVAYQPLDSIDLQAWTNSDKQLQLTEDENDLAFQFRSVDLDNPEAIVYRYKFDDNKWSPWNTESKITFGDLDFGDHTFSAQSRNKDWLESDPIGFNFHVIQPLYKKTWFKNLLWTILGLIVAFIIYNYIKRVKAKNRAIRERLQLENHLLSLEQKALRLQMNPHFIFNVLNGIKGMSRNDIPKMDKTINTFAVLLRETLTNSRKDTITLAQEVKTLKNYIEVERLMASNDFTYAIEVTSDLDPEEVLIPPMLIQPFVENAIRHGIMPLQREGKLNITFTTDTNFLYATVTDNGIGIQQSQQNKPKTDHQSMALQVTKERIESLAGKNTLTIHDLSKEVGTGTKISFKIPLETEF
ncbi:two component regulator with propeller domain [Kordia periserrulae]|uniref:Two component regulator with propeller domain n=1 Tax=Kordia periserrulae TaxID=701523 RepID=A0A2T6BY85_9FLAO|nr:two-component regulator propeller domain-containing protein [Kordia periserrulae]PTX61033.1 two component regulator with propeller domain [Kordia periserrulae]